jgi:hypothetical protein
MEQGVFDMRPPLRAACLPVPVREALAGLSRQRWCAPIELDCCHHRLADTREGIDMKTTEILLSTDRL